MNITGINNNNRLLININENNKKISRNIEFSNINQDFFHRLEFRPLADVPINTDISENVYYKVRTNAPGYFSGPNYYNFIFKRENFFDQSILNLIWKMLM